MLKRGALTGPKLLERQIFHNFLIFYVKLFVETYTVRIKEQIIIIKF